MFVVTSLRKYPEAGEEFFCAESVSNGKAKAEEALSVSISEQIAQIAENEAERENFASLVHYSECNGSKTATLCDGVNEYKWTLNNVPEL